MRIGFFIDDYLPSVHGVATSTAAFRAGLEKRGHEVFVVAPQVEGHIETDDHIIRVPSSKSKVFEERDLAKILPGLRRKFDQYHFDVVHSQTQFFLGVLARNIAIRQGIPHVTTIHTLYTELLDDYPFAVTAGLLAVSVAYPIALRTPPVMLKMPKSEGGGRLTRVRPKEAIKGTLWQHGLRLTAAFANKCDACISPSQHLALSLLRGGGLSSPCIVLPNGLDTSRYRRARPEDSPVVKAPGEQLIVCVARLSPEKRQMVLVDAIAHLCDRKVKLVLVGGGPYEEELRMRAQELGVADKVVILGMRTPEEVAALLAQADLFALASYHFDNQPMVILEASAAGLPTVYCDERLTECLSERNAVLTDGINGPDFARTIASLLDDPQRMRALSAGARQAAQGFDSAAMTARLEDLYHRLIVGLPLTERLPLNA